MDPLIVHAAEFLRLSGPYGLVAALAWAFWHTTAKKDAELRAAYERVERLATRQTEAFAKVEAALVALKEAIGQFARASEGSVISARSNRPRRPFDE